jgi:hypothetical protein
MTAAPSPLRVYLGEDVDVLLGPLLGAHGIDCLTTLAAGNLRRSDEEQLGFALRDSRVLITHNRSDFEDLAVAWWSQQCEHAGIVVAIRRADTYSLARHVLPVLQLYDQAGWHNHLLYAAAECCKALNMSPDDTLTEVRSLGCSWRGC